MTEKLTQPTRVAYAWLRFLLATLGCFAQTQIQAQTNAPGETPCVQIRHVALDGSHSESFRWTLDDSLVGRCVGVSGINAAAESAQHALLERGYVTSRILFQPQDLSSGRLTFTLIPGKIRAIRFADADDSRVTVWNAFPAEPGDVLNIRDIEQALENFKRVPTAEADIRIEPAEAPDESDLVISWKQSLPFRVSASVDDSGTESTGKHQGSFTLSLDHLWTLNDLFYVTANHNLGRSDSSKHGTRGYVAHYSLPWDYWLLGLTSSSTRYHQSVAGYTEDYIYSGTSENAEVKLSRLVHRDATRKTTASIKAWMRRGNNFIDDTEVETQRRATGGWELGLAHKEFIGSATLDVSLSHKRGTAAFNSIAAPEEPFGEGTSRMRITTADVNLNAPFKLGEQRLRYGLNWRAQWNGTPLTPQDKFAIGGRYTVRGFDGESSLSAERGWFIRQDLALAMGNTGAELYAGADYGQVRGPTSLYLVGRYLAGAAIGVRGRFKKLSYDFFLGKPISRPEFFRTSPTTAGFSATLSF